MIDSLAQTQFHSKEGRGLGPALLQVLWLQRVWRRVPSFWGVTSLKLTLYDYCLEQGKEALFQEWNEEKNGGPMPTNLSRGSHQKAWWRCARGHSWEAAVYSRTGGSGCPYCGGKLAWPGENDLASQRPDLAALWHPTKNAPLTAEQVTMGTHHKAWWVCEKGHEWQAAVKTRVSGTGCPYCANRAVVPGENDLTTTHPELAQEWDVEKNTRTPSEITSGTNRKVWWHCEKGHQWQASVASRVRGAGCPHCAGKKRVPQENNLGSQFPDIAAQWHPTKNGKLTPETCSPSSNRKVWWRCPLGHEYQAAVGARTVNGSDCPYCTGRKVLAGFNDLATLEPAIAASWHPTLNGTLTPQDVTTGSRRKVWWECPEGHVWKAVVYSRARKQKTGCPVCAGRVKEPQQMRYAAMFTVSPAQEIQK